MIQLFGNGSGTKPQHELQLSLLLLLLLFRHSAKSLTAQEKRRASSPFKVTRLHPPHADEVRLHMRGNGGHCWCLSSSLSLSVGFSMQDEAMELARFVPQGAQYHADVIGLLP